MGGQCWNLLSLPIWVTHICEVWRGEPMWKSLKPAIFVKDNRGKLQWSQKGVWLQVLQVYEIDLQWDRPSLFEFSKTRFWGLLLAGVEPQSFALQWVTVFSWGTKLILGDMTERSKRVSSRTNNPFESTNIKYRILAYINYLDPYFTFHFKRQDVLFLIWFEEWFHIQGQTFYFIGCLFLWFIGHYMILW